MWMMECTDHHGKESRVDPLFGRRLLRSIIPRPISSSNGSKTATFPSSTTPCVHCENNPKNTKALPWSHHMISGVSDYGINSSNKVVPLVSTRWNPTPEQLMALEEMYKLGTRTPTAEQIQQIASKLRRFGKIEGKNVFYWFQNHKARERQKKRRQLELLAGKKSTLRHVENNSSETKRKGSCSRYNDFELQNKNLVTRSARNKQDNEPSMRGTVMAECINKDEWAQLDHKELQQINNNNNATTKSENNYCLKLDLSSPSFSPASEKTFTATKQEKLRQMNSKLFGSMFILSPKNEDSIIDVRENHDQTLQLFPARSSDLNSVAVRDVSGVGRKLMPSRFFEFLPTNN